MKRIAVIGRLLLIRVLPMVVGLAALIAIIAYFAGFFSEKIPPGEVAAPVRHLKGQATDTVHLVTKEQIVEAVGRLRAADRTLVASKLLATINEITVDAGDEVREGDLLIRLASGEYQARYQQAQQALGGSQARFEEAEAAYQRDTRLRSSNPGTITQGAYDQTVARYRSADAEVRRLQQELAEAAVLLSYADIKAPKAGRIVKRLAEPGDTAIPGQPLLEIYDPRSLRLEAPVPEKLAVGLKTGDLLGIRIDAISERLEGAVDEIVPQADELSRSFLVKVALFEPDRLFEGMSGRLLIPAGQQEFLCLATAAVERVGQLEFVDVVRQDDTLERRLVKTGRLGMPGRVEALSGVWAGERVVVDHADVSPTTQPPASSEQPYPPVPPQPGSEGEA